MITQDKELAAKNAAWEKLKKQLDPSRWTTGESFTYSEFFSHGWNA